MALIVKTQMENPGAFGTRLPVVRTRFIGREREMGQVTDLLASARLVTLTGAAGCGKTRLALQVAGAVSDRYEAGAQWIELAPLADPALIPQAVAKTLQIAEQPDRTSLETLLDALGDRHLLLVLDNCEHLLNACARFVETLLAETGVSILATSRESLRVARETHYPVVPLSVPPRTSDADDLEAVGAFDAVQLFVDRARARLPAFELKADNAAGVAGICRRLDGIPLALELVSARVTILAVAQIAARMDDIFALTPPARYVARTHHETLRAAIAWSYDLLSMPERALLRRLSVFAPGFTPESVEAVCAGDDVERGRILDLLASLVDKSLVVAETLQEAEARYSLLQTIRQYAREKLIAAGERTTMRDRHLGYYLQLIEETDPKLRSEYQQLWLNWLEGGYHNTRGALAWAVESDRIEMGLRMGIALYQFWTIRDYVEEGLSWLERLLARASEQVSAEVQANALTFAALLASFRGDTSAQVAYGRQATVLAEKVDEENQAALAWALNAQGYGARAAGDFETYFATSQRIIELHRAEGDPYQLGMDLTLYSVPAMTLGKYDTAREMLEEGLPLLRKAGDPYRIALALNYWGDLARCEGDWKQAQTAYAESLSLLREIDAVRDVASLLHNLGHIHLRLGDVERARALFHESMTSQEELGNGRGMAECLLGFAALAIAGQRPAAGARLLAAAVALAGRHITFDWAATRLTYEHYLTRAQAGLSERAFETERQAGSLLSLDQAVVYAREVATQTETAREARRRLDELTPREREVAALIAQARSNDEIADELVLSKRTVEKHISNIRSKLALTRRAEIVRWAMETGLVKANQQDRV